MTTVRCSPVRQRDLFEFLDRAQKCQRAVDRILGPAARRTDPATSHEAARKLEPRRGSQAFAILERLRAGPATNVELAAISLKYTGRISDLRAQGFEVVCERQGADGVSVYRLGGAKP